MPQRGGNSGASHPIAYDITPPRGDCRRILPLRSTRSPTLDGCALHDNELKTRDSNNLYVGASAHGRRDLGRRA